nr:hypothetical protein [Morchella crassipes]
MPCCNCPPHTAYSGVVGDTGWRTVRPPTYSLTLYILICFHIIISNYMNKIGVRPAPKADKIAPPPRVQRGGGCTYRVQEGCCAGVEKKLILLIKRNRIKNKE